MQELTFASRCEVRDPEDMPAVDEVAWPIWIGLVAEAANERDPSPPAFVANHIVETPTAYNGMPYMLNRVTPSAVMRAGVTYHEDILQSGLGYRDTAVEMITEALQAYIDDIDLENYE